MKLPNGLPAKGDPLRGLPDEVLQHRLKTSRDTLGRMYEYRSYGGTRTLQRYIQALEAEVHRRRMGR